MEPVPYEVVTSALAVHRCAHDATESDYYLVNGMVRGNPDGTVIDRFCRGISVITPELVPHKLQHSQLRSAQCFVMDTLGEGWRLVFTHSMSLPITKSERQIVKHFLLYPTSDITLDAFHSEANCVGTSSWTPCEFADGAGEEDFEYDLERDGEGISDIRVYGLLRIIYYDLINNTSAFDATLLCGFYFWLVDDKTAIDNLADDRGRAALLMSYLLTITDGRVYWARTIVDAIEDATGWLKIGTKMSLPPAPSLLSSLFSRLTTLQWPLREFMEILEDLFLGHVRRALPAAPTAAPQRVVRAVKPEPGATGSKRVRQEVTENEDKGCVLPLLRIVIIVRNSMRSKECTQR